VSDVKRSTPTTSAGETYDVLVVGGGSAGICAAVQAARTGARTLLVEKSAMLGGTTTNGGVNAPSLFDAWGRQVISGVGWELVTRVADEGGAKLPDFTKPGARQNSHAVFVSIPLYAAVADQLVIDSGCELRLHTMLGELAWNGEGYDVTLCQKEGLRRLRARAVVDASADANAVAMAGFEPIRRSYQQPGTLLFKMTGYNLDDIDIASVQADFEREVKAHRLRKSDAGWYEGDITALIKRGGYNTIHVCGIDGACSASKTQAELKARRIMLELYRFMRRHKGLDSLRIDSMAAECGIRDTVTICGLKTVTFDDYWSGRLWDDAVCYSFYPIDVHTDCGLDYRELPRDVVPTIPLGAMIPEGSHRLLAPGRHMSSDLLANSALRVQSTAMASGQAAGAIAAISASTGLDCAKVDLEQTMDLLESHGAIVPRAVKHADTTEVVAA
jgi:hypothetical protein